MAEANLTQAFIAALVGGLTVKLLDIFYQEFKSKKESAESIEKYANDRLEPFLKSADEVVGKLRHMAESDFRSISKSEPENSCSGNYEIFGILFLIGGFWAHLEIIRKDGFSIFMSKDERSVRLASFIDCLESRRIRILDRFLQRAVGEIFISENRVINFVEFVEKIENDAKARRWIEPLQKFLCRMGHTTERQRLLQYGVIIHALVDTLDPDHLVTKQRPPWPNKISRRTWKNLKYGVFSVYLGFVPEHKKYYGPPKEAARKQRGKAAR